MIDWIAILNSSFSGWISEDKTIIRIISSEGQKTGEATVGEGDGELEGNWEGNWEGVEEGEMEE